MSLQHSITTTRRRSHRRGFTFVEVLVVVSIVLVLIGIGMAGAQQVRRSARTITTRTLLQALVNIAVEHDVVMASKINPDENTLAANWDDARNYNNEDSDLYPGSAVIALQDLRDGEANLRIERFVSAAFELEETQTLVRRLTSDFLTDREHVDPNDNNIVDSGERQGDGFYEVRDSWGTCIDVRVIELPDGRGSVTVFTSAGPDEAFNTDDDLTSQEIE